MSRPKRINELVHKCLNKIIIKMMSDNNFEEELVPIHDKDFLMRATFDCLTINLNRTLKNFIVFEQGDTVAEVKRGTGERAKVIDTLITYFENQEEYEKCQQLLELKELVINNGN